MRVASHTRVGISAAWALAALACGGPVRFTESTPPPMETGSSEGSRPVSGLIGTWQLVALTETGQRPVNVAEGERFTVEFSSDGRVALRADCNRCSGAYESEGNFLAIGPMACTRAFCPSAPFDSTFTTLVGRATSWQSVAASLELRSGAGRLQLRARVTDR